MTAVAVEITTRTAADEDEIEFVDDLDAIAGNETMRGCGNDNSSHGCTSSQACWQ
ncbi:hypothetical protein AB0L54_32895 [Streptomyces sp. NPDC052196]|uniref:hypothetical protein n=1 Tax=Streptomyces sp. NPDC052196 TaxID=3156691 RepID=UPI003435F2FA